MTHQDLHFLQIKLLSSPVLKELRGHQFINTCLLHSLLCIHYLLQFETQNTSLIKLPCTMPINASLSGFDSNFGEKVGCVCVCWGGGGFIYSLFIQRKAQFIHHEMSPSYLEY